MKKPALKSLVFLSAFFLAWGFAHSAITVTAPSSRRNVKAAADFADEVLLDRWDMNQRTDLGWRIFNTVEQPQSYLGNISFQNGIFSATTTLTGPPAYSDANIFILDSAYVGSAMLDKNGKRFPINADKYTQLALRMYIEANNFGYNGQILWSKNTIYGGMTTSNAYLVHNEWFIYIINIPALGVAAGPDPWSGIIDSLRLDPIIQANKQIQIDWIRLVENDASTQQTITWTGNTGNVDIYLDNDNNSGNGDLGKLAEGVGGTGYTFLTGALSPGDYYVAVTPAGTSSYSYSVGYFHVNDVPILKLNRPNDEGSDQDFITVSAGDPWDMANSGDVDHTVNVQNPQFTTINYEDLAGNSFNNNTVFLANSTAGFGDPIVFFLNFFYRGKLYRIDTDKYHNLVFKMGIAGTPSINDGSIARVIWRKYGEQLENVSQDIIIRHLDGKWIMDKVVLDMKALPLEDGGGSPSRSGWTGEADCFRIDPHEFSDGRQFFFDDVRLTSDITAFGSYTVEWAVTDSDHTPALSLYYDTDNSGYNGTLIASGVSAPPGTGSYDWNLASVPPGKYWVYAVVNDGVNTNRCYARGPVVVGQVGTTPGQISLSKRTIFFGAVQNSVPTTDEKVVISNSGQGTLTWQAEAMQSWLSVYPPSGTGNGEIDIGINTTALGVGTYQGTVRVSDPNASNSPQYITVNLTIYSVGADSPPFGSFDTPLDGSTVSGSIAVTGWALDDVEVKKIIIKREPVSGDPPALIGTDGLVYIGDAVFVKGARGDIEALYPTYPRADRAGWGYMMLTFGLPNRGNGTFRIHAIAEDANGRTTRLGIKQIISDNVHRINPFGTIDTPAQSGVISGTSYASFGWALTPPPNMIPVDGSTVWMTVDSVTVGHPAYNLYRSDIAQAFPECLNAAGAVGLFNLDSTKYANGVHTIGWLVYDNAGNGDGMGSRFVEILNLEQGAATQPSGLAGFRESGRLRIRPIGPREIEIEEMGRVEIALAGQGGARFVGWGRDKSKPLPVGSSLEGETGVFCWSPAPGFLGKQILHFALTDGVCLSRPVEVVVNIVPRQYEKDIRRGDRTAKAAK